MCDQRSSRPQTLVKQAKDIKKGGEAGAKTALLNSSVCFSLMIHSRGFYLK